MKTATATLESISPYSQSRQHDEPKLEREQPGDYETRTWRKRLHVGSDGRVFIPPMAFKNAIGEAAKFLQMQIPGKGKSTYTKHFEAGVLVPEGIGLGLDPEKVEGEWLWMNSDGVPGSGKRVKRCYPRIADWSGRVGFLIVDEIITPDVFRAVLEGAGTFIGIGRFRPRNRGYYGRFKVVDIAWS